MTSSARLRRSRFMRSAFGTRIFRKRPMKKSGNCSSALASRSQPIRSDRASKETNYAKKTDANSIETVSENAHRLTGSPGHYDPLMDRIGNARFVLLGEASHGTY